MTRSHPTDQDPRARPGARLRRGRVLAVAAVLAAGAVVPVAWADLQPGQAGSGGGAFPALPRDGQDHPAPDAATLPRELPALAAEPVPEIAPGRDADAVEAQAGALMPGGFGVVTHVPGGVTQWRDVSAAVLRGLDAEISDSALSPRIIGPRDTRRRVADATVYPERAAGLLLADFGGLEAYCTAALIGPATVLTAAHCVHDLGTGWAERVYFLPGVDGDESAPFGSWPVVALHVPTGFLAAGSGDYAAAVGYDIALLTLRAPVGDALGWFGFGPVTQDGSSALGREAALVRLLSYPGDKPVATMWQSDCTPWGLTAAPGLLAHLCPTFAGASGGPMFTPDLQAPRIAALNVAETPDHNLAVAIGPAYAAWLADLWR